MTISALNITLVYPYMLLLLVAIPAMFWWKRNRHVSRQAQFLLPNAEQGRQGWRSRLRQWVPYFRIASLSLLLLALTRPQRQFAEQNIDAEGIDIMMVMDLSSSMLAKDFTPDRLEASKAVAREFVNKRKHDRIGLVVFAGEAFTQCPLTTDHRVIDQYLANLQGGFREQDTATGMGLAIGVNGLKSSNTKSKVIILLTDGVNNRGYIQPVLAAELAKEIGVKIYSIGVGTTGEALSPINRTSNGEYIFGMIPVEIDEDLLRQMSTMTNGRYYRATSQTALKRIYDEIDKLEKTKMNVTVVKRYTELFYGLAAAALLLLVLEFLIQYWIARSIP